MKKLLFFFIIMFLIMSCKSSKQVIMQETKHIRDTCSIAENETIFVQWENSTYPPDYHLILPFDATSSSPSQSSQTLNKGWMKISKKKNTETRKNSSETTETKTSKEKQKDTKKEMLKSKSLIWWFVPIFAIIIAFCVKYLTLFVKKRFFSCK